MHIEVKAAVEETMQSTRKYTAINMIKGPHIGYCYPGPLCIEQEVYAAGDRKYKFSYLCLTLTH